MRRNFWAKRRGSWRAEAACGPASLADLAYVLGRSLDEDEEKVLQTGVSDDVSMLNLVQKAHQIGLELTGVAASVDDLSDLDNPARCIKGFMEANWGDCSGFQMEPGYTCYTYPFECWKCYTGGWDEEEGCYEGCGNYDHGS